MKYIARHAGLCNREKREYPSSQVRKQIPNNEAEKIHHDLQNRLPVILQNCSGLWTL
jgi:hypothetical protein